MAGTIPAARHQLIGRIAAAARGRRGASLPLPLGDFIRLYYRGVDEADLLSQPAAALAHAAAGHLRFGALRRNGQSLVRAFNPTVARDGWDCDHTVIEIVTDDMPFLIDSLAMVLNELGHSIEMMVHPVLNVRRDVRGRLRSLPQTDDGSAVESWQHICIARCLNAEQLSLLQRRIEAMLQDVRLAVSDWPAMRRRAVGIARSLASGETGAPAAETAEASEFMMWLADNHFTFLGYREYRLERGARADRLVPVAGSGLGLLRTTRGRPRPQVTTLDGEIRRRARERTITVVTKANSMSTVHRATYLDYVGIKTFNARGAVIGERRFIGLFTSNTYTISPFEIPLLRHKVQRVFELAGVTPVSHDGKALTHLLATHPRDELFQASVAELDQTSRGIVNLYERRRVRLFLRRDPYQRFFSCLLYVPRDRYNTQARQRIESILREELGGNALESQVQISDSALARLLILVRTANDQRAPVDVQRIEQRISAELRNWTDQLRVALRERFSEEDAESMAKRFGEAFPIAYQDETPTSQAIADIEELLRLPPATPALGLALRAGAVASKSLHLRLYRRGAPLAMSDLVPQLENFDLRILNERIYRLADEGQNPRWIQDLEVTHAGGRELDPAQSGERFKEAFFAVHEGRAESDGFNRLVLSAGLHWRQALVLRAVCRYLLQTGLPFSQRYMENVLAGHRDLAARLVWTFEARFDPRLSSQTRISQLRALVAEIGEALEQVSNSDEDRILRAFHAVMLATLRTNHYQRDASGAHKSYLALKLDPQALPELPKPRPMFEIWVYSPRVEGVHLRMGRVARGGLRWSDRREDFRTEVLGLMKAQNVKNTLIVPVGAKGGFVPKQLPLGNREAVQNEGVACYRTFIRALLDLTDNVRGNRIVPPVDTVRHDADDPYLVVAADKGTATFSDIANAVAAEYDFWLGDAFASGGSAGYDHKGMGITAKGAWECVKRHFRELGIDTQVQDFTVIGIGDMAGDVFGNGMLLSKHIRLLAAFNHQHIFLDPDPDTAKSYAERERLFRLPRSAWSDYNPRLISRGGGVFARDAKDIQLSPQARTMLGITATKAAPIEVIRAILKMPADLLWNGGIGTYVKASSEAHSNVGDRSNDAVRIDGRELRCKVVGEGGNLGVSQPGRIEFAAAGGRINTDFVDNSGGVDCSDHEVNIKILLKTAQEQATLTTAARNSLLARMTNDVGELVLRDNYLQSQAISLLQTSAAENLGEHAHFIRSLELTGVLDRQLEHLPSTEEIQERQKAGRGLTRPELAMLLSYSKIALNQQLMQSDVPEDPYLSLELARYFPSRLGGRYASAMQHHRLRREIIATATTNSITNRMGPTFVLRTQQDTGADAAAVARAYSIAREVFDVRDLWGRIESLDNRVPAEVQYAMMRDTVSLISQVTYWMIQRHRGRLGIEAQVSRLRPGVSELAREPLSWLRGLAHDEFTRKLQGLSAASVPNDLAQRIAACSALQCAPDIVELAAHAKISVPAAAVAYFDIGSSFGIDWIRQSIESLDTDGHWHSVARGSLREAVYITHRMLAERVLAAGGDRDPGSAIERWVKSHDAAVTHARSVVNDIRAQPSAVDFASLSVALQSVRRLVVAER